MVTNLTFRQILDVEDVSERTAALRRAFAVYSAPMDVTGNETSALTVLLNLTYPKSDVKDLLDQSLARSTLRDKEHIDSCVNEVQWLHSHNLKYPDIRVSKQRLKAKPPIAKYGVISGANCLPVLGWSHDSGKVNLIKLFGTYFFWQRRVCCLAELMQDLPKPWEKAFEGQGMQSKQIMELCYRVSHCLPGSVFPNAVDRHSVQVRMPYRDGYLAITPVVSHSLQLEIQKAALSKQVRYTSLTFARPTSVGDLAASLGGSIKVLNYPPRVNDKASSSVEVQLERLYRGETILNLRALSQLRFKKALELLLNSRFAVALKQRRNHRVTSLRQIRASLAEWIAPIVELRAAFEEKTQLLYKLDTGEFTLERQLVTLPHAELSELLKPLLKLLNSYLSNHPETAQYAFHQQLMLPLKSQLKWLLSNLCADEHTIPPDNERPQRYLYLKGIRVHEAQALSNLYCAGVPSLTAVWGMLHRYQRQLNGILSTRIRLTSFAWYVRSFSYLKGKRLPELGMHGHKQSEFRRPGIIDLRYCDLTFDLVIHLDGFEDDLDVLDIQPEALKASFPTTFAGGVMHPPEVSTKTEWCTLYQGELELYSRLCGLSRSGTWIMPTKYKLSELSELIGLLSNDPSLCPTMLGYLLLGAPQSRANSQEALHCYAEAAIGVVQCINTNEIRLQGMKNFFNRAFWMLDAQEQFMLMKRI
jgi:CRISPR-associated protein Csy2